MQSKWDPKDGTRMPLPHTCRKPRGDTASVISRTDTSLGIYDTGNEFATEVNPNDINIDILNHVSYDSEPGSRGLPKQQSLTMNQRPNAGSELSAADKARLPSIKRPRESTFEMVDK